MAFVAFLDACVLFPPNLRDVILTIAETGICQIRWSSDVLDEMYRNIVKKAKVEPSRARAGAQYLRGEMEGAFPDAMVDRSLYEHLIPAMPNDVKDRHVLAAAVASRADVLDTFLCHQLELAPRDFFHALEDLASKRHEPMNSVPAIVASLQKTVPNFSSQARDLFYQSAP